MVTSGSVVILLAAFVMLAAKGDASEAKPWSFKDPLGWEQTRINQDKAANVKKAKVSLKSGIYEKLNSLVKSELKFGKEEIDKILTEIVEAEVVKIADLLKDFDKASVDDISGDILKSTEIKDALNKIVKTREVAPRKGGSLRFPIRPPKPKTNPRIPNRKIPKIRPRPRLPRVLRLPKQAGSIEEILVNEIVDRLLNYVVDSWFSPSDAEQGDTQEEE